MLHEMCGESENKECSDRYSGNNTEPKSHLSDEIKGDASSPCSSTTTTISEEQIPDATPLPLEFSPSSVDVIVGTGREAKLHKGNINFRGILESYIDRYSHATYKLDKTMIISEIVRFVKSKSPFGAGFVKKIDRRWHVVGEHLAREKVSQGLRNILHDQYRSSQKSKKRRRGLVCKEIDKSIDGMMQAKHNFLSDRIDKLSEEMKEKASVASDEEVSYMFTQANIDILEGLKKDASLQNRIHESCIASSSFSSSDQEAEEEPEHADKKQRVNKRPRNKP
jgi:hypothetical protein